MASGLTPNQIKLRTGGYRTKRGIIGGYSLPADIDRDRRAGIIKVVPSGRYGIKIKPTKKGAKIISKKIERRGMM